MFLCLLTLPIMPAQAGVPEAIHPVTGAPLRWINPAQIPYAIDPGPLGRLAPAQARELVAAMMGVWEEADGVQLHFVPAGMLGTDVTVDNIGDYVNGTVCADRLPPTIPSMREGESPVIFDHDGRIIDLLAGIGASEKIVGRSGFRCYDGTLADPVGVTQSFLIMNGRFIDGADAPRDLSTNAFAAIVLHELGHFLGLHHSMVNESLFGDLLVGRRPIDESRFLPVMYPLVLPGTTAGTVLKPDDRAAMAALYPAPSMAGETAAIEGRVTASDGKGVRGANVVARRVDDPLCQAVATVSGRFCTPLVDPRGAVSVLGEWCAGDAAARGAYRLEGLAPGSYAVEVSEIVTDGGARQNMFPKGFGADLPGPAEYYNVGDVTNEDPRARSLLALPGGAVLRHIDIALGRGVSAATPKSFVVQGYTPPEGTPCRTDPVDYDQLMAIVADESAAEGASGLDAPLGEGGGCALLPDAPRRAMPMGWIVLLGGVGVILHCKMQSAKGKVQIEKCKLKSAKCKVPIVLGLWGVVLLVAPRIVSADSFLPTSPAELAAAAGQIFYGECIDVQVATDSRGLVVTDVTYAVQRMIKGDPLPVITFRMVGAPVDRIGDAHVLFLYPASAWGLTSPVGGWQGRFPVTELPDGTRVVRSPFAVPEGHAGAGKSVLPVPVSRTPPTLITPDQLLNRTLHYLQPRAP